MMAALVLRVPRVMRSASNPMVTMASSTGWWRCMASSAKVGAAPSTAATLTIAAIVCFDGGVAVPVIVSA